MKIKLTLVLILFYGPLLAQNCGNINACNYNSDFDSYTIEDCIFPYGCSNPQAINYTPGVPCDNEAACLFLDECGKTRNGLGEYAGFVDDFKGANWIVDNNGGNGIGAVNPAQLTLYPDVPNGTPVQIYMTWFGPGGTLTFDYEYTRVPSVTPPSDGVAQYIENGISNSLFGNAAFGLSRGTVVVDIEANGIFGFELPANYTSFCEGPLRVYNLRFTDLNCVSGCTYGQANNYDPLATHDDGSCLVDASTCVGDLDGNQQVNSADLLIFLGVFGGDCF